MVVLPTGIRNRYLYQCYQHNPVLGFLSPAFAGGGFSSSGVNPPSVVFSAPNCHAAAVQTQHSVPFASHTVSPNINDYYTSDANLWRLAATTSTVTPAQCCNAENIFSKVTTVVPPCNIAAPYTSGGSVYFNSPPIHLQHVPLFSILLILVFSQSTMTTHRLSLIRTKVVHRIDLSPLVNWRNY